MLLIAIVVLAITLPIVFTRRTQQEAANAAAAGRSASGVSGPSGSPAGTPVIGSNPVNPGDVAGTNVLAPVGPNLNTGDDVFCYKSASTGAFLPGAFRKTGVKTRDENDIERVEVRCEKEKKESVWLFDTFFFFFFRFDLVVLVLL